MEHWPMTIRRGAIAPRTRFAGRQGKDEKKDPPHYCGTMPGMPDHYQQAMDIEAWLRNHDPGMPWEFERLTSPVMIICTDPRRMRQHLRDCPATLRGVDVVGPGCCPHI